MPFAVFVQISPYLTISGGGETPQIRVSPTGTFSNGPLHVSAQASQGLNPQLPFSDAASHIWFRSAPLNQEQGKDCSCVSVTLCKPYAVWRSVLCSSRAEETQRSPTERWERENGNKAWWTPEDGDWMSAELKRAEKLGMVIKMLSDPPRELWREIWNQQRLRTWERERLKSVNHSRKWDNRDWWGMRMGFTERRLRTDGREDHRQKTVQRRMGLSGQKGLNEESSIKRGGQGQKIWRGDRTETSTSPAGMV